MHRWQEKPVPQISTKRKKPLKIHPWQVTINDYNSNKIMRAHNSVGNPVYPKPKEGRKPPSDLIIFTVIGNRVAKEFIYCVNMVQGMHKYRRETFGAPIIRDVTALEWAFILNKLKVKYNESVFCLPGQVAVLYNDNFLGGEKELKDLIEERYIYYKAINYPKESIDLFRHFVTNTGRACAYLHIAIDDELIGCLIFMLYSDIVPNTCENFLRLCQISKGGYSGTPVHRIVEGGWIQCGGFGLKDTPLGCENYVVPHDRRGVLGMCNAERGIDCSTQFFVLLQPALWMNHKYVAFGQLIEGDETLKKIEKISTFYESPTKNIIISKAGIVNMECDGIMINRGAVAYIDAHIEDLVSLGAMLSEWLMESVAVEIQFRYLKCIEAQSGEGEKEVPENDRKDIRATERFMRKKEEIRSVLAANPVAHHNSSASSRISGTDKSVNEEFDVGNYKLDEFAGEGYTYSQVTHTESESKETRQRPYYIPLTDVPYPGERDSNFDLKRLLQGHYCLENDLDPKIKTEYDQKKKFTALSHIMNSYSRLSPTVIKAAEDQASILSDECDDIDKEEIESITRYLRDNMEKVSYSGEIFQIIGKKYIKSDPGQNPRDTFNDEEVRRMRMALHDLKIKQRNVVSIVVSPWETHNKIKRRQTGFETKVVADSEQEDDNNLDADFISKNKGRIVSIRDSIASTKVKLARRQTGFPEVIDIGSVLESDKDTFEVENEKKCQVSIEESHPKRSTHIMEPHHSSEPFARPSVLARLYEDLAQDSDNEGPTLKEYKPMKLKTERLMLSSTDNLKGLLTKSRRISAVGVLDLSATARRVTDAPSSYPHNSEDRSFYKRRHAISIEAYREKNQLYAKEIQEEQAKNKESKDNVC